MLVSASLTHNVAHCLDLIRLPANPIKPSFTYRRIPKKSPKSPPTNQPPMPTPQTLILLPANPSKSHCRNITH